ncbi:alpha-glucosidase/alpha-galactosidase [Spirochaetia bacterium]|nr:alpha-glucosidase/alpha-galactosidase [Spirochaetia bacterium]
MRKKIVLIGAGSAVFTKGLVLDVLERSAMKWHIALVDTSGKVLDIISAVVKKMIAQKGADVELSVSTDRRDVLAGADYVVSTIGVGGRRSWEQDVFIPREFGIFQPVGDTVGPGGISRALRMIPQLLDIARDVEALCPGAVFFNYSNPMTMNCMGIRRGSKVPVIGLCHGVKNGLRRVAAFMGTPQEDLSYTACGLNHMVFMYHLRRRGKDMFPAFIEKLDAIAPEGRAIGPLTADFVREHHTYVVSDDRHFSEFVPETLARGAYFGKTLGMDGAFHFEETIREGDEEFALYTGYAASGNPLPDDFFVREPGEHELLMDMIESLEEDRPGVYYVNVPNNGAVAGLPADVVVERPALFSGSGVAPLQMTDFPVELLPYMARYTAVYEIAVQAALSGDARLVRYAIEACCLPLGRERLGQMTDRLLAAHKDYLPQFR